MDSKKMEEIVIKCSKGHYYHKNRGSKCPFCNHDCTVRDCLNGHSFDALLPECPYCYFENKQKPPINDFKKCKNGHLYKGDYCSYCPDRPLEHPIDNSEKESNYNPIGENKGQISPICPKCGKQLRRNRITPSSAGPYLPEYGYVWNDGWDGVCENCRKDFNFHFTQDLGNRTNRVSIVKVASKSFPTERQFVGEVLSGIEFEIVTSGRYVSEKQKIFISTNELKYLIQALKNSPILEQFDWGEDWSYAYMT